MIEDKHIDSEAGRVTIEVTLNDVWNELPVFYLGHCRCGRLNIKARVIGHYDDFMLECPGCRTVNHISKLHFTKQLRA